MRQSALPPEVLTRELIKVVTNILWTVLLILLVLWALGLGFGVAGNLVHILLVVAAVVLILQLVQGRGRVIL
jgi:hypothetical protein